MARPPSEEAFTDFVHAQWPSLYRTAYLLLGEHGLAEDLVQTALAKTYASWGRVRDREAAPAYARAVLVNTARSWFRKRGWRRELATDWLPESAAPHRHLTGHDDEHPARSELMHALTDLPPRQRAVVVLRFYEDLSVAQTAELLDCSPGTVKSQTHDALNRLRALLGEVITIEGSHHD